MNNSASFIEDFYKLEGKTVTERHRNFLSLLKKYSALKNNEEQLQQITTTLIPRTHLEAQFKFEFLIYFRRTKDLYVLLKEGNEIEVNKIIKQTWFFQELFTNTQPEDIVNNILPSMSFSVRSKVINKLSKIIDEQKFDKIFEAVMSRYGISTALRYITGCSAEKIQENLVEYPSMITLKTPQLKILYRKNPELLLVYFEHGRNRNSVLYSDLLRDIFKTNKEFYDALQKKFNLSIKFGRRLTKKYLHYHKEAVIKSPREYINILQMKTVVRKLGPENVQLFFNTLPKKPTTNRGEFAEIFSKRYHYSLFVKAFEQFYQLKIDENLNFVTIEVLKDIPDVAERIRLAEIKYNACSADAFLPYLSLADSIEKIKERINFTQSIDGRARLVQRLLEACSVNNSLDELTNVMKYFLSRHKNDELDVHLNFVQKIESLFSYKQFNEEQWKILNDLFLILAIRFMQPNNEMYEKIQKMPLIAFNRGTTDQQKLCYLEFLFLKAKPIDTLLEEYFSSYSKIKITKFHKYDEKFKEYLVHFALKNFQKIKENFQKREEEEYDVLLARLILAFNEEYPDKAIKLTDFPEIYEALLKSLGSATSFPARPAIDFFESQIFTHQPNAFREEFLKIFWSLPNRYVTCKNLEWFLKHEPCQLVDNFDAFQASLLQLKRKDLIRLLLKIKKNSHVKLDAALIRFCQDNLRNEKYKKRGIVIIMVHLMKLEDILAIAEEQKPIDAEVDLTDINVIRDFELKTSIASSLRYVNTPKALPVVLHYCLRDYFKSAMGSLYWLLYRTPENSLSTFYEVIANKSVAIRKHLIYLACVLSPISEVTNLLAVLTQTEKVNSLRKYLFETTVSYFLKNPTEICFELVKRNMVSIAKSDSESLCTIVNSASSIPEKFASSYIEYAWNFYEKIFEYGHEQLRHGQNRLFSAIDAKRLNYEFAMKIYQENFLQANNFIRQNRFYNVLFDIVCNEKDKQEDILKFIFTRLNECKNPADIRTFFVVWQNKILKYEKNLDFFAPYIAYWEGKINRVEQFYVYVKYLQLKLKLEMNESPNILKIFTDGFHCLIESLIEEFGQYILPIFTREFMSSREFFAFKNVREFGFYHALIKEHPTINICMFLTLVMKSHLGHITEEKEEERKRFVVEVLKTCEHPGFQIILKDSFTHYKNLE